MMCDCFDAVGNMTYMTITDFLNDVKLLYYNAIVYNGVDHAISKVGASLLQTVEELLSIERKTLGAEHDSMRILEDVIQLK